MDFAFGFIFNSVTLVDLAPPAVEMKCNCCALVTGLEGADVVLSCSLIEEGGGMGGMMGGAMFKRTPSTLVFRDLVGNADLSPELVTPYNPPETPNADDLIFELMCKCSEPKVSN